MLDRLFDPERSMRQQRLLIHEHRLKSRQSPARSVEDGKAVGVDVAPVSDLSLSEPRQSPDGACRMTQASPGIEEQRGLRQRPASLGYRILIPRI